MGEFSKPLQIYVVEDSPIMLRLLESTIEAAGAALVGHSPAAQRAITEISVLQPDLILIDISLDFGNGFDVLRVLRDQGVAQSARKVVLTNHASVEYRDLCFRLGANQFFDKASETSQVLTLIGMMAAEHGPAPGGPAGHRPEDHSRH